MADVDSDKQDSKKDKIITEYLKFVKKHRRIPNVSDMVALGITRHTVKHHFGNITKLHDLIDSDYSESLEKHIVDERTLFTQKHLATLNEDIAKYDRFVVTTAVTNKNVHVGFLNSLKSYCEKNNAKLLILPCMDIVSRSKKTEWQFPSELNGESFVFEDSKLNENIFINNIKLSAKHINPLTGLSRIGQRNGTFIYASPKQFLEFVATTSSKNKIPHALMTTGAVTESDYRTDFYMSARTSYIAENDHVLGAVVVEIEDEHRFHFRQVQSDFTGAFIDLGTQYLPSGKTRKMRTHVVLGDWHTGATEEKVRQATFDMFEELNVQDVFLHDFFDGYCISHHDLAFPLRMARKSNLKLTNLQEEVELCGNELNEITSRIGGKAYMVQSNHDEFLHRYLDKGTYVDDPENHYFSLDLARKMLEGTDPLEYAITNYSDLKSPSKIVWLRRDEDYKIGNVELGAHGDLGANGAKASLPSLEKAYGACVVGHTHSAAIFRGVYRVGTSTRMSLDYNRGPSSWTNSHCLIYNNGSRQLIHFIDGKWKI